MLQCFGILHDLKIQQVPELHWFLGLMRSREIHPLKVDPFYKFLFEFETKILKEKLIRLKLNQKMIWISRIVFAFISVCIDVVLHISNSHPVLYTISGEFEHT